ncbi:MAG TPA: cysteine hydrolase family protein [Anaerolineales bacterium]|jgi:nicotinamidase-related amidase
MSFDADGTALLVIDVQQGFDDPGWGQRNNPHAEANIARLLAHWRGASRPVLHAQHHSALPHSSLAPGQPGNDIKPEVSPHADEPVFGKTVNSALIGTDLEAHLRRHGIKRLVLVGLTTDHCVSTTARMAANLGFEVAVVSDASATFERTGPDGRRYSADDMHATALASLHGEFASIVDTQQLLD